MDVDKVEKKKKGLSPGLIVGIIIVVFALGLMIWPSTPSSNNSNLSGVCSQITGTPAWMQDGEIIGYGEQYVERTNQQNYNDVVNDYLIPNKISFVFDYKCSHCLNEINRFGSSWQTYQDSGLTKECNIL